MGFLEFEVGVRGAAARAVFPVFMPHAFTLTFRREEGTQTNREGAAGSASTPGSSQVAAHKALPLPSPHIILKAQARVLNPG